MKKIVGWAVCVCLVTLLLTGCGQAKTSGMAEDSTLAVSKDGKVTFTLVGVFEEAYHTVEGLEKQVMEEAAAYNQEHGKGEADPVVVKRVEAAEDGSRKVIVEWEYDSAETFSEFNESFLFYGTVEQAIAQGVDMSAELFNVKKPENTATLEALAEKEKHILLTDEKAKVYCPGKVTYISHGAALSGDGSVDALSAEDTVYILMK